MRLNKTIEKTFFTIHKQESVTPVREHVTLKITAQLYIVHIMLIDIEKIQKNIITFAQVFIIK